MEHLGMGIPIIWVLTFRCGFVETTDSWMSHGTSSQDSPMGSEPEVREPGWLRAAEREDARAKAIGARKWVCIRIGRRAFVGPPQLMKEHEGTATTQRGPELLSPKWWKKLAMRWLTLSQRVKSGR